MDWQPIETAPRDGTAMIAYAPSEPDRIVVVKWQKYEEAFCTYPGGGDYGYIDVSPTHWMPIPVHPKPA